MTKNTKNTKNTLSKKGMAKETDTICGLIISGKQCRGTLMSDNSISKLEISLGHRKYTCDKCFASFKFMDN
jgi:hypothetical protein